ncbi:asparagine synthetase B [Alishewanella longhuensis]|uniref:asparagine synthase (glutamine-hydrolyzing) n=1 Tax=Alishewanella longhuensis TaxID=1091037 RepID=A0ABQ3L2H6_9ALTE|nr:asparagine synthase (glutamine-hydrolyzing) [Alishewanella longhuensis]GHG69255.1 asparagine synthetase B [Alishewanella longhuensis]
MCGILGWYGETSQQDFLTALHMQQHRGPDDWGYQKLEHNLQLGHRRLSIIDLKPHAKQPMTAAEGRYTVVFNGEIYNYLELKLQLAGAGYRFHTESDTEVLINAWDYWGSEALQHFIGMFAFAIYCHRSGSLTLARDRFGIKPLFIYQKNNHFGFASEAKSLLSLMPEAATLDLLAVNAYFSFRYPLTKNSFFNEITPLPPGHILHRTKDGDCHLQRYYCLAAHIPAAPAPIDLGQASTQVRAQFQSAIDLRMIADVPVGAYLSGGVDSSAVVAAMASTSKTAIKTFSVGFSESGFNEFEYAAEVAARYHTEHTQILLSSNDYLSNMQHLISIKDAPLGVPNEVPLYLMSKQLKNSITVVLSGEGADEIFAGYGRLFRSADDYAKLNLLHQGKIAKDSALGQQLFKRYGNKEFTSELAHFLYLYRYQDLQKQPGLFTSSLTEESFQNQLTQQFQQVFDECPQADYASKMLYCFEHLHLPGLLQRVDATTMATGVEARVPFVDHRLVELAFSLPITVKLAWQSMQSRQLAWDYCGDAISEQFDTPKAVLKHAFANELSTKILYRRKLGFPVPLAGELRKPLHKLATDILPDGLMVNKGLIHRDPLLKLLASEKAAPISQQPMLIWMLVNLELFLQHYFSLQAGDK